MQSRSRTKKVNYQKFTSLKKTDLNGSDKVWLEGHSSFSFDSSSDKWQATVISERDKKVSIQKCISSIDVRRSGLFYSQTTHILLDCERDLKIPSAFKSTLRTSEGKWFSLNLNCGKQIFLHKGVLPYLAFDVSDQAVESASIENPFTFTGREFDKESGLFFYRARYYDSGSGRFLNEDPIGFVGGDINLYRYVANDPINCVEPDGAMDQRTKYYLPPIHLFS